MALRGNALTNACLLIILMRVFSVRSLTCHLTEYQIGNECCPMCPPGNRVRRDCTEIISTSCLSCAEGTYMDKPNGQKQCMSCSVCGSGGLNLKIKQACMQTSDTVCEPLEGFFCTDSTSGSCTSANKHKLCKPGQYINKTGTSSSDTECSDCSTGTFSDGSVTSCQPHTQCETLKLQLIKAGTASADAECGEKSFTGIVIGAVVGAAVVLAGLAVTTILYIKKKRKKPDVLNCFKNKPNKDYSIEHENTSIREEEEEGRRSRHGFIRSSMLTEVPTGCRTFTTSPTL